MYGPFHVSITDIPPMCCWFAKAIRGIPLHAWFAWFQVLLSRSTQYKQHPARGPNRPLSNFHHSQLQYDGNSFKCLVRSNFTIGSYYRTTTLPLLARTGPKLPFHAQKLSHKPLPLSSITWNYDQTPVMYQLLLTHLSRMRYARSLSLTPRAIISPILSPYLLGELPT